MALNLEGFYTPEQSFEGLNRASETLERRRYRQDQLDIQRQGKINAAGTFLNNYLDKKDFLTGTNYDPELVRQLDEAMQEGASLAQKGADTPTIMMALGPKISRLNEYSTKAKLIDKQIKDSLTRLKPYKGYNIDAIESEAKKMAFYDENGKLKDITTVDPDQDWITETMRLHPEKVTTGAGIDDFVAKVPMSEYSKEVQTMFAGKKRNVKYDAKSPFYMDIARNEKGEIAQDLYGNPIGLDVVGDVITDDKGNSIINPDTNEPFRAMDKGRFNAIVKHNPDIADYLRGQVNSHFKELGQKVPEENSPQWEMMARSILRDELKTRDRSFFKMQDNTTKSTPVTRIELGYPAYAPRSSSGSGSSEPQIRDVYSEIDSKVSLGKQLPMGLGKGLELNELSPTAQKLILEYANKLVGSGMTQSDIALVKSADGTINIVDPVEGKVIAPIDFGDINVAAQPGIKEKRKVIEQINKTYKHKGKSFTHAQVEKAAKQSGMSVEEYIKQASLE